MGLSYGGRPGRVSRRASRETNVIAFLTIRWNFLPQGLACTTGDHSRGPESFRGLESKPAEGLLPSLRSP